MFFKALREDIDFAKKNDPAARSKFEIWLTYPGVKALSRHRVANFFYRHHMKLLARPAIESQAKNGRKIVFFLGG